MYWRRGGLLSRIHFPPDHNAIIVGLLYCASQHNHKHTQIYLTPFRIWFYYSISLCPIRACTDIPFISAQTFIISHIKHVHATHFLVYELHGLQVKSLFCRRHKSSHYNALKKTSLIYMFMAISLMMRQSELVEVGVQRPTLSVIFKWRHSLSMTFGSLESPAL